MKAASQQRRTLSFKEGLQEIKRTWGLTSGQQPEENPPAAKDKPEKSGKPARGSQQQQAGGTKPAGKPRPRPQQQAGASAGKPRQQEKAAGTRSGARPATPRAPERSPRPERRGRPPLPANLSDEEKARIERNRQLNTVWNVFAKHYVAFRERLPLKIGVLDDLAARHPDYDRALIVAVLKRHVNHPRYHERVAAGGSRYELDGSVSAGTGIEPSHIGRANAALARQKARAEARSQEKQGQAPQQDDVQQPAEAPQQETVEPPESAI